MFRNLDWSSPPVPLPAHGSGAVCSLPVGCSTVFLPVRVILAVAYRRDGPISSTSSLMTVRRGFGVHMRGGLRAAQVCVPAPSSSLP